jgi:transcription elongation factor Elf1
MKHKQEHLTKGYVCPYCGEDSVEGDEVVVDGIYAEQEVSCTACDKKWVDQYKLISCLPVEEDGEEE